MRTVQTSKTPIKEPEAVPQSAIARAVRELAAESEHRQKIAAFEASTQQLRGGLDALASAHVRLDLIAARMGVVARLSTRPQTRAA